MEEKIKDPYACFLSFRDYEKDSSFDCKPLKVYQLQSELWKKRESLF